MSLRALLFTLLVFIPTGLLRAGDLPDAHRLEALRRHGTEFFGVPTTFTLGGATETSMAAGDFNDDGRVDLVIAKGDDVWLLAGDGLGNFASPTPMAVRSRQQVVGRGDVDGDGREDEALADQFASSVSLRMGAGAGGSKRLAVLLADFDQNGTADLASVDGVASHVTVMLGGRSITRLVVGIAPVALAAGDVDGDGNADLVVANRGSDTLSILLGDGDGGFGNATHVAVGAGPSALIVTDLNGDGLADVAVVGEGGNEINLLFGDGAGGFGIHRVEERIGGFSGTRTSTELTIDRDSTAAFTHAVVSLTLSPATITGGSGASSTGTVTLDSPAPAGGAVVSLSSSNFELAAMVPTVTVPEGATSATFSIATNALYVGSSRVDLQACKLEYSIVSPK